MSNVKTDILQPFQMSIHRAAVVWSVNDGRVHVDCDNLIIEYVILAHYMTMWDFFDLDSCSRNGLL